MADQPARLNKTLMQSPYYVGYSSATHNSGKAYKTFIPNGNTLVHKPKAVSNDYNINVTHTYNKNVNKTINSTTNTNDTTNGGVPQNARAIMGPAVAQPSDKDLRKLKKQARHEKDYFFVMRKGVCFLMFLMSLVIVAVMALSLITNFSLISDALFAEKDDTFTTLQQISAIYVAPDNTPVSTREEYETGVDAEGNYLVYDDTSTYYGYMDPVFGMLKSFGLLGGTTVAEAAETDEAADTSEDTSVSFDSTFYDDNLQYIKNITDENDTMAKPAAIIFQYTPIVYVIIFITAIVTMFTSFIGMFGKRIYKGFGAAAIIMLVCIAVVAFSGIAVLGAETEAPYYDEAAELHSIVNADYVGDFLLRSITGAPAAEVDLEVEAAPVPFAMGLGSLIIVGGSAVLLVLSFFARRKLPYSIFDK